MHCNLKAAWRHRQSFWAFWVKFILRMRKNCYFQTFGQTSVISDPISYKKAIIWRSDGVFRCFIHCIRSKICHISISDLSDPLTYDTCHYAALRTRIIITYKFEFGQPICSWLITFLLLIRLVTLFLTFDLLTLKCIVYQVTILSTRFQQNPTSRG